MWSVLSSVYFCVEHICHQASSNAGREGRNVSHALFLPIFFSGSAFISPFPYFPFFLSASKVQLPSGLFFKVSQVYVSPLSRSSISKFRGSFSLLGFKIETGWKGRNQAAGGRQARVSFPFFLGQEGSQEEVEGKEGKKIVRRVDSLTCSALFPLTKREKGRAGSFLSFLSCVQLLHHSRRGERKNILSSLSLFHHQEKEKEEEIIILPHQHPRSHTPFHPYPTLHLSSSHLHQQTLLIFLTCSPSSSPGETVNNPQVREGEREHKWVIVWFSCVPPFAHPSP